MRLEVNRTEADTAVGAMVVHRQICEPFIACACDEAVNELGCQRAIAIGTCHVVSAFLGKVNFADAEVQLPVDPKCSGKKYCAMFVVITREEVREKDIELPTSHANAASVVHCKFSRKSMTFNIFATAFCWPPCAAEFLLEI